MLTDNLKPSSESISRMNKLVMDTYQSLIEVQMESLRGYMEIVKDQARSAMAIRDLDSVKDYIETQPESLNALVNRMSEDFRGFTKVTEELRDGTSQIFNETVNASAEETTKPEASTPAKKASAANN